MTYYIDTDICEIYILTIQWSDLHRLNFKCPSFICPRTVPALSKILELAIKIRLTDYFDKQGFFSETNKFSKICRIICQFILTLL
jgi:hypothetical protein